MTEEYLSPDEARALAVLVKDHFKYHCDYCKTNQKGNLHYFLDEQLLRLTKICRTCAKMVQPEQGPKSQEEQ